ncbi:hypothetical protein MAPG_04781 [Magnaporthiopsis poae ATCC 64411]|uniref:NADP-dependent oxidoreductase domain-containing protein n=1 Tax=Magnaporthiopsis poae (strain ATCC 64411 / 73-15) TaxID=644358 RepID=A0A0C4DXM7_MAGP6|nr:hypothetical protein MAPG_04781 [Magnaporthiopsis poae ATCC 64411]
MANVTASQKTYTLNNGAKIPAVGLGTYDCNTAAIQTALEVGYRHVDTAKMYSNEREVGDAIKASGVPRDQIWITTKLGNTDHKRVAEALDKSLEQLQTDYVDLYLMHWPASLDPDKPGSLYGDWDYVDTWREMQKLLASGKARTIGVSNFGITHMERLLADKGTKVVPAVNQIELHPFNPSPKLVAYLKEKGIHASAYSPLGAGNSPVAASETVKAVAEAKGKTPQQVLLKWGLHHGFSVIPKSVNKSRIEANFTGLDGWDLDEDDVKALDNIKDRAKVCGDGWLGAKVFLGDDE